MSDTTITAADRTILRELGKQLAEAAALPIMEERRRLWRRHNALKGERAMILVFPEGAWRELLPDASLSCQGQRARAIEQGMRMALYEHAHFQQDKPVEAYFPVAKAFTNSGWGLEAQWHFSDDPTGARAFAPVIQDAADLQKIKAPKLTLDEEQTQRRLREAHELFDGVLPVRLVGVRHISFHLLNTYTSLRGLEQVMMDMIEEPQMLHDAMGILERGNRGLVEQYEQLGLLDLNNDDTYHSSGGVGYSDELPAPGYSGKVRPCDMWCSAESQELAQVSPEMHEEFALTYERRLLEPFGLNGYGCCEDLTRKLDDVMTIRNIRRLSISPWANFDACAEKLKGRAIFSWKAHPAHLAGNFHADQVRAYIRHTVEVCKANGCMLEMILKDTHTCDHHPERFDQWTTIAREEVSRVWG